MRNLVPMCVTSCCSPSEERKTSTKIEKTQKNPTSVKIAAIFPQCFAYPNYCESARIVGCKAKKIVNIKFFTRGNLDSGVTYDDT